MKHVEPSNGWAGMGSGAPHLPSVANLWAGQRPARRPGSRCSTDRHLTGDPDYVRTRLCHCSSVRRCSVATSIRSATCVYCVVTLAGTVGPGDVSAVAGQLGRPRRPSGLRRNAARLTRLNLADCLRLHALLIGLRAFFSRWRWTRSAHGICDIGSISVGPGGDVVAGRTAVQRTA
jgi:hypothetical protein